jgi:ABC-2 type transport system ATP-binding protein
VTTAHVRAAVDEVTHRFGRTVALDHVTARFAPGRVSAVVGGDGAGKSTLLRCLVGQVVPGEGRVTRPVKHEVGYMPATSGTWLELSVAENIGFVLRAHDRSVAREQRRVDALLERAGLAQVRGRLAGDLSGGMRKKLGFVLAVIHEPSLLVLDEPSTGVDPVSRVELWGLVVDAAATGATVVMATTYLDEAERANSLLVLDRGEVLAGGTRTAVLASAPGTVTTVDHATDPERAWRRGAAIRQWSPTRDTSNDGRPTDLEDAVIAHMLARADEEVA